MTQQSIPGDVSLFSGIMYRDEDLYLRVLDILENEFGPVRSSYGPVDFSARTAYYDAEMGGDIKKQYVFFRNGVPRDRLADIKVFTNGLEGAFSRGGKRQINLDPGYLTKDKLVLASAKDFFHRIYLSQGIYAEVTLHFRQKRVKFFSWTYEDYLIPGVKNLLLQERARLLKEG
jgi:hypothetical protein